MKTHVDEDVSEYLIETFNRRKNLVNEASFFRDEYRNATDEIIRLTKRQDSYLRSFVSFIVKANSFLYTMNDSKIPSMFKENGFKETRFYVEELRRYFFNDKRSEALRKYNCINISDYSSSFSDEQKIDYKFCNGKDIFSIRLPYKNDIEATLSRISNSDYLKYAPFSYGTIDIIYYNQKANDDYFDDVKIFVSHDIEEVRSKIVEFVENDFKDVKKN